jgi:hypothetical protein
MRIEAVQNERRPYTNHQTKHELMTHVLNHQRIQKSSDSTSLNTVKPNNETEFDLILFYF